MSHYADPHQLRDDVERETGDTIHEYTLPLNEDDAHSAFDALHRALWSLKPVAKYNDEEEIDSAFVYAHRRFGRIFKLAYEYDATEVDDWRIPTVGEIHSDIRWYHQDGVPPRTFTLEKTKDELKLTYEHGFHATDEILEVDVNEETELKASALRNCGQGIKDEHTPYDPSVTEKWRYSPSKVKFSIEQDEDTLRFGIENTPPKQPLWYRFYKHISTMSTPYAYATFDMENQTSVVKFVYNRNRDEENQI